MSQVSCHTGHFQQNDGRLQSMYTAPVPDTTTSSAMQHQGDLLPEKFNK